MSLVRVALRPWVDRYIITVTYNPYEQLSQLPVKGYTVSEIDNKPKNQYGDYLRAIRNTLKMTQKDLASYMGTSASTYSKMESDACKEIPTSFSTELGRVLYMMNVPPHMLRTLKDLELSRIHSIDISRVLVNDKKVLLKLIEGYEARFNASQATGL